MKGLSGTKWKEVKLSDVIEIIGGGTPKTRVEKYWNGDIPWLSVKDFNNGNKYVYTTEKYITEQGLQNSSTKLLDKDDLIISARGTVGEIAQLGERMAFNQSCYGLKGKHGLITNTYLYYLLSYSIKDIQSNTHGSVFDTITRETFNVLDVSLPSLSEQKAIADTLSCLDDKIELNNRINKNLEEIAQAIFKSWFLDFEPFQDGEFEDSELGRMPKGWRVRELGEIVEIINGYSYKGSELTDSDDALMTIKNFDRNGGLRIDGFKEIEVSGRVKERQYLNLFDVLVACTDLTQKADIIGNPILVLTKSKYNNLIASMDLVKVVPKVSFISNFLLYILMKDEKFKQFALGYTAGTTVLHLDKKAILEYKIALPIEMQFLKDYSTILELLFKQVSENINKNRILTNIRDSLLPKLMSGEVRVPFGDM